ncbi:MOLPALP family lipoprotein [Mycoplasma cottewii]|uniref:MOLPALP family lipoprotein n=1 Tax=Mycoplasma cottewii TaxID=51364 RepID=A0ABY5TXE1_9MOLU|nr:MOLPALP family lipoprotein [Mycoplasma cottewii]UWD35343.1 MOLPALP family lipoprotein [Mycoplasma cottewii]
MKKLISVLTTTSLLISSISTISCTYTKNFAYNVTNQMKMYMNISSIAAQSAILSSSDDQDQSFGNISTDYSLQTFAQTQIKDLFKGESLNLMNKFVIDKNQRKDDKLTYENQFKSMFGDLSNKKWTETLQNVMPQRSTPKTPKFNWNNNKTKTTSNSLISTLTLISGGLAIASDDILPNQQGVIIGNILADKNGLLESTAFTKKDGKTVFSDLINTLNKFTDESKENNKFNTLYIVYELLKHATDNPSWLDNIKNETKISDILKISSEAFWSSIFIKKEEGKDQSVDWINVAKKGIDLLKAVGVYQRAIELKEEKITDKNYDKFSKTQIFSTTKNNIEFLNEILSLKIEDVYSEFNKDITKIKQNINSINIKSILNFIRSRLTTDENGYNLQRIIVMLFGSPNDDIKQAPILSEFYKKIEDIKLFGKSKLPEILKPFVDFVLQQEIEGIIPAIQKDLVEQGENKEFKKEYNRINDFVRLILIFLGISNTIPNTEKILAFLSSEGWSEFLENPYIALYKGKYFFRDVFFLINEIKGADFIPDDISENLLNIKAALNLKLDKIIDFVSKKINKDKGIDGLQYLYGLKDKTIREIIDDICKQFKVDDNDTKYILNLLNINALVDRIFNSNITLTFKNKEQNGQSFKTNNSVSTIVALLGLTENNFDEVELKIDNNALANQDVKQIQEAMKNKKYALAGTIILGFNPNQPNKFVEKTVLEALSWLFGHRDQKQDLVTINTTRALIKAYLDLVNWFTNKSIADYEKDNLSGWLDQNKWKTKFLDVEGDINNSSEIVKIKYELSYGDKTYNIEVSNSTNINESWKFNKIELKG